MSETTSTSSDTQAAINAGIAMSDKIIDINGTPFVLQPPDCQLVSMEDEREAPRRIQAHTSHSTTASFLDYYNHHCTEFSVIMLDTSKSTFTAIIDYHAHKDPDFCDHTAAFVLKSTPEWLAWLRCDKVRMSQADFGQFIESNREEIITPDGAEMLEIALSIQAKTETNFSTGIRLDNGQIQLTYSEVIDGSAGIKGQLKIPEAFEIGLHLFEGAEAYSMKARLRYRIKEGNLTLWYELIRPHKTIEENTAKAREVIEAGMQDGSLYSCTINE